MTNVYENAGVDYDALDRAKRKAIQAASATDDLLTAHGGSCVPGSRGEPAFSFKLGDDGFAFVLECLGTKSVLARRYHEEAGVNLFHNVGYDAVAAIVNDLVCVGALPLVVTAYFSTGHASWYSHEDRFSSLVDGWAAACRDARATWGGGESPSLPGLVSAEDIELAGSAVGRIDKGRDPLLGEDLRPGDEIVLVASSGLHANGASLVRTVAEKERRGLLTELPSGRTLGEAALDASVIYVDLVRELLSRSVDVTYLSHITGHGLRKVMRPAHDFTYRLTELLPVPEVLSFLADRLEMNDEEAYATFNMGCGFAVYCARDAGAQVVEVARSVGLDAAVAGVVEEGPRKVVLEPVGVTYSSESLSLR
ncbi:MAG: phosphoribosylformylglycinamidine cyclo-ligase [Actinobacteria bacterium]|nr:phosphoribosylformylglycinamidine cyclo-ligase [Actinomycetota bacterium]